jgi:hypothetical protein
MTTQVSTSLAGRAKFNGGRLVVHVSSSIMDQRPAASGRDLFTAAVSLPPATLVEGLQTCQRRPALCKSAGCDSNQLMDGAFVSVPPRCRSFASGLATAQLIGSPFDSAGRIQPGGFDRIDLSISGSSRLFRLEESAAPWRHLKVADRCATLTSGGGIGSCDALCVVAG